MKEKVSVIIVTYNRPKDVTEAVESLLNQSVKPLEVIVIVIGCYPHLNLGFRTRNLKIVRFDQEVGLSNARNYGVRIAEGEYIAFIDDDCIADRNWIEEIQKGLEGADIIGGIIQPLYQAVPPDWWNEKDFGGYAGVGNIWAKEKIWGCNMAFRTEVFRMIGGFNPRLGRRKGKLFSGEEMELIDRARNKGFNSQFVPAAVVYHKVPARRMTFNYIVKWNYYNGKSTRFCEELQPPKKCGNLPIRMFSVVNLLKIFAGKQARIHTIAKIARRLGKLF